MWTVLLVDDDEGFRQLEQTLIGLDPRLEVVGQAGDGDEALEAAARLVPDAIVLDQAMPGRTGIDVLPDLRRLLPGTLIVMYTSTPREDNGEEAFEAGADTFLDKRTPPVELVRTVARMLEERHPPPVSA